MKGTFTKPALRLWQNIPAQFREQLLQRVWCGNCHEMTTIVDFIGRQDGYDLILIGSCVECGNKVARLIEGHTDIAVDKELKNKQAEAMNELLDSFHHHLFDGKKLSEYTAEKHCHIHRIFSSSNTFIITRICALPMSMPRSSTNISAIGISAKS